MMEAVDLVVQIVEANNIRAQDVSKVVVSLFKSGAQTVDNRHMPDVNIQYILSAILLDGKLTFAAAHDYGRMQDKQILDVKERIQLIGDEALARFETNVEITLWNGKIFRQYLKSCRGRPDNPMDPEEVEEKAARLMAPVLGELRTHKVLDSVRKLESVGSIRDLTELLMPGKD